MGFEVALDHVSKHYGSGPQRVTALDDITLEVRAGAVVAVTGPSGSGKSTLLHVIGAMDKPDAGSIRVGDTSVTVLARGEQPIYRRHIGFIFQRFHLLPTLTSLENVVAPVLPRHAEFDKFERARELLKAVGLGNRADSTPSELSGGEQQRVAIARALINEPGLLLADEPTGNLDSTTSEEIIGLLMQLREARAMTILVASHDPLVAASCDRIVSLKDGRVIDDVTLPNDGGSGVVDRISRLNEG